MGAGLYRAWRRRLGHRARAPNGSDEPRPLPVVDHGGRVPTRPGCRLTPVADATLAHADVTQLLVLGWSMRASGSQRRAAARRRGDGGDRGAVLPRIDGLDSTATALTRREAQLVELAARGLSNAEIADRLALSVRTVETHLYRAMQKLGVRDRRELRS
jgi:DNA-binding CsgD family transcriptional regulator